MTLEAADAVVRALHADSRHQCQRYGPAHAEHGLDATEEIPGILYSYLEEDRTDRSQVRLYVYLGIGSVAGALWEQEMRVLERISGLEHPALPKIIGGGHLRSPGSDGGEAGNRQGAAFIRVAVGHDATNGQYIAGYLAEEGNGAAPALQYLWQLADALSVLHDSRIVHRNLWPGTLVVDKESADDDGYRITLARFEMSALLANLLRSSRSGPALRESVQRSYRDQAEWSRVFAPPERLDFVFGSSGRNLATAKGDVFSLGIMAAQWLLGPDVLPTAFPAKSDVLDAHAQVRTAVTRSSLPLAVQALLQDMLHPREQARPTAAEVTAALVRHFGSVTEQDPAVAPYLVVFMPGRQASDKTLLEWKYIDESSDLPQGHDQVVQLIERDMALAQMLHSPDGAEHFIRVGKPEGRKRTTTVIAGKELLWFVEHYWTGGGMRGPRRIYDHAVVIKYVLERQHHPHVVTELQRYALPSRLFKVDAVSLRTADARWLDREEGRRPSWRHLTKEPKLRGRALQAQLRERLAAMDWYLEYQGALLEARTYAFERRSTTATTAVLVWDREAEQARSARLTGMRLKVVTDPQRPSPTQHVLSRSTETAKGIVLNLKDADTPHEGWLSQPFRLLETRGAEELVVEVNRYKSVPVRGWLRLDDDRATRPALIRQSEARLELEQNPALLRQLVTPSGRANNAWQDIRDDLSLSGEGKDAVVDLLENQTMFALQGPPGTGKTEVTSEAVRQYLIRNRDARVLVSAQSHDALDNLAERILRKLDMLHGAAADGSWLALRVAGERAQESLSETMRGFLEESVARRLVDSIRRRSADWLAKSRTGDMAPIVGAWREVVREAEIDLRLRLRRGANLVFATTGAATRENLVTYGSPEPFDWVVVEEAARAWPTELALALVRGTRWTLVGDQAQIGPYSRLDIEAFLESCEDDPDEDVKAMAKSRVAYGYAFETFASMFADAAVPDVETVPPTRTLSEGYRMATAINEVVSTAFYRSSGGLVSMRDDWRSPVDDPECLGGQSLVWIDTEAPGRAEDFWRNPYEVGIVTRLVERITPQLLSAGLDLAVLAPYRRQCEAFVAMLDRSLVHTIDGFQGREANVVIASLVRDKIVHGRSEIATVGHVAHEPRANVLLSRARDLLIIVGAVEVYEHHAGEAWSQVVRTVRSEGRVVTVKKSGLL